MDVPASPTSAARVYWTAFIGLLFDYYDLYLFVYLGPALAAHFELTQAASDGLQFAGLAGVGVGALAFGGLADRFGRGRIMLVVFGVYVIGIAGLSLAWDYGSLLGFRLLASMALGAEWGISHTYLTERVDRAARYRFSALLQFAILGGLLAALAKNTLLATWGWRWLFAASIVPVLALSLARWRVLSRGDSSVRASLRFCTRLRRTGARDVAARLSAPTRPTHSSPSEPEAAPLRNRLQAGSYKGGSATDDGLQAGSFDGRKTRATFDFRLSTAWRNNVRPFAVCFGLASLTIASGTFNVFYAKDLPQSFLYTVFFWGNVAPGMLAGAWVVRRLGVGRGLAIYAAALIALSFWAWTSAWPQRALAFALVLPLLNGLPFGLMGAFFNEVFGDYRTMLSGSAYNLGRILAGFSPALITALGLHDGGRYFLFTAALGAGVLALSVAAARLPRRL